MRSSHLAPIAIQFRQLVLLQEACAGEKGASRGRGVGGGGDGGLGGAGGLGGGNGGGLGGLGGDGGDGAHFWS